MYAQFFGSYLLGRDLITTDQLNKAISRLSDSRIRLGTLAMHEGLMTPAEVNEVCYMQTREDKRFGEIAVEREYLTQEQVDSLLKSQNPDFLLLGQNLVDLGAITNSQLEEYLRDYQDETGIDDMGSEDNSKTEKIVGAFFAGVRPIDRNIIMYVNLLFNDLVRFIGDDFTPMEPSVVKSVDCEFGITQKISGQARMSTGLIMEKETAVRFASRYAKMRFDEFDEYVMASAEDFLNLHNGLFCVNISNESSVELSLDPPVREEKSNITFSQSTYQIPIDYTFGKVTLLVSSEK